MDQFHLPQHLLRPNFGAELKQRFDGIERLLSDLVRSHAEMSARLQAQGDAIQALISATPDLDKAHESLLTSMDVVADHVGQEHLELFQKELSRIQALILAEQARRRAV